MTGSPPGRRDALKGELRALLLERVGQDRESAERSQADTKAAATHEENRAEHAKDTRATEQSYLARGLAGRAEDLRQTEQILRALELRTFEREEAAALTALVTIEDEDSGEIQHWWLVPVAGGIELAPAAPAPPVRTLTPKAPLGRALLGLSAGDSGEVQTPRGTRPFEVLQVE